MYSSSHKQRAFIGPQVLLHFFSFFYHHDCHHNLNDTTAAAIIVYIKLIDSPDEQTPTYCMLSLVT